MNVNELTSLVIDKFKNCSGYIETDEKHMRRIINTYLGKIYQYDLEYAAMKLEHNRISGNKNSKDDYVRHLKEVEDYLLFKAEQLSVSSKEELENLV